MQNANFKISLRCLGVNTRDGLDFGSILQSYFQSIQNWKRSFLRDNFVLDFAHSWITLEAGLYLIEA